MQSQEFSQSTKKSKMEIKLLVKIALLAAMAVVLMLFDIPIPFIAPSFYKIDLSEVPVLVGGFALGPIAGIVIEGIKILLSLMLRGSQTGGVGELANFIIGCSFVLPASLIYLKVKTKKGALIGLAIGSIAMAVAGCLLNYYLLLPLYSGLFHMPIEAIVKMGHSVNPIINSLWAFILIAVLPFNIIKGAVVSLVVLLIYKKIRVILNK